jgi:hypothetical protein
LLTGLSRGKGFFDSRSLPLAVAQNDRRKSV